ncbi:hypothetical protein MTO96_027120 [Rhipicephalus appendiculatus]
MDANTAGKKPKAHWTDGDTRALLKVWEDHLADLRRAKRNIKVYVAMQECLRAQGIEKSVKETKSKIENLANRYKNLSRKRTGQGAVKWRFYAEIAKFLSCLPINNGSLVEETTCEDATVEMLIHSMEHGQAEQEEPRNEQTEAQPLLHSILFIINLNRAFTRPNAFSTIRLDLERL